MSARRDHSGHVIGTISISGPVFRVTRERLPAISRSILAAAHGLSAAMGYASRVDSVPPAARKGSQPHYRSMATIS